MPRIEVLLGRRPLGHSRDHWSSTSSVRIGAPLQLGEPSLLRNRVDDVVGVGRRVVDVHVSPGNGDLGRNHQVLVDVPKSRPEPWSPSTWPAAGRA